MIKLSTQEILALAAFDPDALPDLVKSAMGKLMQNYASQLDRDRFIEGLAAAHPEERASES
jgi:hypothetical protein